MASQLQIANWACTLVAQARLSSLSDSNQNAEIISEQWDFVRDVLLTSSAWNFAIERASLAADSDVPEWGFDYQYSLSADVVRVLQVSETYAGVDLSSYRTGDTNLYRVEGRKILTDLGAPLYVKWIVNSKDVGEWAAPFAMLMAADLAVLLNPRANENLQVQQALSQWRMQAWALATSTNAIEQPSEPFADSEWMAAHAS